MSKLNKEPYMLQGDHSKLKIMQQFHSGHFAINTFIFVKQQILKKMKF